MQAYVNLFVESVNNRLSDLMKQLVKLMGKSDTKPETIQKMEDDINECIDILTEINMLSESSQVYDIFCYDEESLLTVFKIPLNPYGYVAFLESLGIIIVEFFNGGENIIELFAHELKHAYQFEVGEYSIGPNISRLDGYEDFPNLLYDITDEYAAYERQNFFREDKFTQKEIVSMPLYRDLIMNSVCWKDIPFWKKFSYNEKVLRQQVNVLNHAFRVNGVTYYKTK